VAVVILASFLLDVAEAQILPSPGTPERQTFIVVDALITLIFTAELALNIFAHSDHGMMLFCSKPSNCADLFIVVVCLFNMFAGLLGVDLQAESIKLLRLLGIVRVVRLLTSLKDLNKILRGCSAAVVPVCNAFVILLIVAMVYAILGTQFFKSANPEYFSDFQTSLFTMFQILLGDSWASGVARSIFSEVRRVRENEDRKREEMASQR